MTRRTRHGSAWSGRARLRGYLACGLLALMPVAALAGCNRNEPDTLSNYDGTLGDKTRVRMTLVFHGEQVEGLYFYASWLKDIPLKGRIVGGSTLELDELDASGKPVARFEARFPEQDPRGRYGASKLECEVIAGTWRKLEGGAAVPVYLSGSDGTIGTLTHRYAPAGASDDALVHRNAQRFWEAVKRDDRKGVAATIAYPLRVNLAAGKARRYRNASALLADYDTLFTPRLRESIANAMPRNMFVRDQGIMLGSGEVWFGPDGKVIVINP